VNPNFRLLKNTPDATAENDATNDFNQFYFSSQSKTKFYIIMKNSADATADNDAMNDMNQSNKTVNAKV